MTEKRTKRKIWMLWAARIWSLPAILFAGAELLFPHPGDAAVPWQDWVLLGLIVLAVLGLIVGWRWALVGGQMAVSGYLLHILLWPFLRGGFAPTWWMLGLFVAAPGALMWLTAREG